ncbi:MAG TPA: zinc-binding dehydrogenase [Kofleriaceae bacterium]|nr:zinc-binding dehydrogenase [Kofleriaceae bacterium]
MREPLPLCMRAAIIAAPRTMELCEVLVPVPGPEEVLIRVEGCGVCGSSLPVWEGRPWFPYPRPPGTPGHEGWGTVAAVGARVTAVAPGARVGFLSERAFAEYDVAPATSLVLLPAGLRHRDMPAEALGCAMNIWRRSGIEAGQTVAVVGVGFLGALLVQLAARAGARAIAISQRAASLEVARRMGAAETIELLADDTAIVARAWRLTGGAGCDRVLELTGAQRPLDLAAKLCRVRGRLVIAGFHQDGPRQIDMFLWNWRGLDVINAHERAPEAYVTGMAAALDRMSSGQLDPQPLYTHRVPLARADEAFELLRQRPDGFVKALVIP